jgi:hypothetical protein
MEATAAGAAAARSEVAAPAALSSVTSSVSSNQQALDASHVWTAGEGAASTSSNQPADPRVAMVSQSMGEQSKAAAKEDSKTARKDRLLYVGVFSKPDDFKGREAVRNAWLTTFTKLYADPGKVKAEFIIGRMPLKAASSPAQSVLQGGSTASEANEVELDVRLGEEFKKYQDLFHVPYEELPVRVLMFYAHAVEMGYQYIMKIDVNQELLFRPLLGQLKAEPEDAILYAGQNLKDMSLLEVKAARGKKTKVERYFSGPCYLTSWSLAHRISKKHLDHSIMLWSYNTEGSDVDDMDMGQWVAYEDKILKQLREEKRRDDDEQTIPERRVDYRIMDICRKLPEGLALQQQTIESPSESLSESPSES